MILHAAATKSLQSCPTLCDPMDSSPPGSPVPGILQARIPEWVAISFSVICHTPTQTPCVSLPLKLLKIFTLLFLLSCTASYKNCLKNLQTILFLFASLLTPYSFCLNHSLWQRRTISDSTLELFFDLLVGAFVIKIIHNGLPQRTCPSA